MEYEFFYDETEHSRKINYQTVTAENYYDNFISVIVGWQSVEEQCIIDKYLAFESKYDVRKVEFQRDLAATLKINMHLQQVQ